MNNRLSQPLDVDTEGFVPSYTVRPRMTATLTADHRVGYGTDAAEFLAALREGLEAPQGLVP